MFGICAAITCSVQNFTQTEAPASDQLMWTCLLTPAVRDPRGVTSAVLLSWQSWTKATISSLNSHTFCQLTFSVLNVCKIFYPACKIAWLRRRTGTMALPDVWSSDWLMLAALIGCNWYWFTALMGRTTVKKNGMAQKKICSELIKGPFLKMDKCAESCQLISPARCYDCFMNILVWQVA